MGKPCGHRTKKAVVAGAAIAMTVGIGATAAPDVLAVRDLGITKLQLRELRERINLLASSETQVVGVPDWLTSVLGGGGGLVASSDTTSQDIYNLLKQQDKEPLIGWGTGGVKLEPQWNTWYNLPVSNVADLTNPTKLAAILPGLTDNTKDQYYTAKGTVQTGTVPVDVENPDWRAAFDEARRIAMQEGVEELAAKEKLTVAVPITFPNPAWDWKVGNVKPCSVLGSSVCGAQTIDLGIQEVPIDNPFNTVEKAQAFIDSGQANVDFTVSYSYTIPKISYKPSKYLPAVEFGGDTIEPSIPISGYTFTASQVVNTAWDDQALANMDQDIPKMIKEDQPVYNDKGYWTTTTSGQWVSPTDYFERLQPMLDGGDINLEGLSSQDLFYFANMLGLSSVGDLENADASDIDWNKLAILAPVLNWTTYIQNVNLVGYGDGNIVIGDAYRQFVRDVDNGTIQPGIARTDGRYLTVLKDADGNPIVRVASTKEGEIWDYPLPTDSSIDWPTATVDKDGVVVEEKPGGVIDFTLVVLGLLRNPGRPNGGLYSRFAPLYEGMTGVNPVTPERADRLPDGVDPALVTKLLSGNTDDLDFKIDNVGDLLTLMNNANGEKMLVTIKADATWAYDMLSDAPVTANPVAWANSAMSSLFLVNMSNELLSASGKRQSEVGLEFYAVPDGQPDAGSFYATLTTGGLPLLAPLRLPANLIGTATGEKVQTPFADTIEPLARILTNIGYTDVVTPEKLAAGYYDDDIYDGKTFVPYERTYREMHNPVLFGTQTLNQSEIAHLQGDLLAAVGQGLDNGWDASVQAAAYRLVDALGGDPADIKQVIEAPGNTIREVGNKIGEVVSDVLVQVNDVLPQLIKTDNRAGEQKMLADIYKPLGQVLKPVRQGSDLVAGGLEQADAVLTGGQFTKLQKDPIGSLINAGGDLQKSGAKLQKSLGKAQKDADDVVKAVTSGDPSQIGKTLKDKADYRVGRAKKDIDNGVNKVKAAAGKVKDAVKKVTDKVTKTGE